MFCFLLIIISFVLVRKIHKDNTLFVTLLMDTNLENSELLNSFTKQGSPMGLSLSFRQLRGQSNQAGTETHSSA